jgi:peroxiredoxin
MKRLIHIIFVFLFSVGSVWAQSGTPDDYWDDVDFNDTTFSSNVLRNKIINYLYENACVDEAHFDSLSIAGLDVVFERAKVNMRTYEYVLELMLNGHTNMGRSAVTDYLLNYPQLSEGEITIAEGLRLDSIAEPYQKVRVGAKAPDFSGLTIDEISYHLYESDAKNVIIVFWSTDCEYCHDFLTDIRKKLDLKSEYELVTFALAEDLAEVQTTVKKMRLPGYHFYDEKRWDGKVFLDYHVTSTPTVFLLDENKVIVCKPYDWNELKQWLKLNR